MAMKGDFMSGKPSLFGLGALLIVGYADAAQQVSHEQALKKNGDQIQLPHTPDNVTTHQNTEHAQTTPLILDSHRHEMKHGANGDALTQPRQAKTPHGTAVENSREEDELAP